MTPQEKAEELIERMKGFDYACADEDVAKRCANISVNEILQTHITHIGDDDCDDCGAMGRLFSETVEFWTDVRDCLNKY